jgi:hypothetical protein
MVTRYGFTWYLLSLTGGGVDANNDPIAQTAIWTPFLCDAQLASGRFVVGATGDQITLTYSVFFAPGQGLTFVKGGTVKDHHDVERIILESEFNYLSV